jgi:hypothetical protein
MRQPKEISSEFQREGEVKKAKIQGRIKSFDDAF